MIKVIMDSFSDKKQKHYLDLGYEVNTFNYKYNPDKTWHQINWAMILKKDTSAVIFDISNGYKETKAMITGALKHNVPVVVLLNGQRFNLRPEMVNEQTVYSRGDKDIYVPNELTTLFSYFREAQEDLIDEKDREISTASIDFIIRSANLLGIEIPSKDNKPDIKFMVAYVNNFGRDHDVFLLDEEDTEDVLNKYITLIYYKQQNLDIFNEDDKVKCPVCKHYSSRYSAMYGILNCSFCGSDITKEAGIIIEPFGKEGLYED